MKKSRIATGLLVLGLATAAAKTAHACSTVYFDKGGQPLLGHNMDWFADRLALVINKRNVQKHGFVFPNDPQFTWTSKYGSISFIMEGREITGRGMNEAGLVILEMAMGDTVQSTDSALPRLSVGQWAQYQLDTSATIKDVIASDKVVRISAEEEWQSHFLLWDRTGALALIEWLEGKMVVIQGDELEIPVFVNASYDMCMRAGNDPSGRFKRMSERYAAYDPTKDTDGFEFVHSILEEGADMLSPPLRTLWQFIIDPRAQRLSFTSFDNSKLRYVDLKDFDFSCQTPVEVFDLKSGDAGDVRSAFVPYTTSYNTDLVRYIFGIYESFGIPTSSELIDKIIAFPDSTTCMETVSTPTDAGIAGDTRVASPDGEVDSPRSDAGKVDGGQGQTATGTGGTQTPSGTGGTVATGGTTTVGGTSSGCSCTLESRQRTGLGLYAGLFCAGMVAWRRIRRRAADKKPPSA